jgi:CheY-like chemotaxis protein
MATILIVDDDPDFVEATQLVLFDEGYTVESASGGKEGFQKAQEIKPDLIILDVMMDSVLDGVSITRKLHEHPITRQIPIIMVTSIANTDYAELFPTDEYIHIEAFLSKPVDPEMLIKKVRRNLRMVPSK